MRAPPENAPAPSAAASASVPASLRDAREPRERERAGDVFQLPPELAAVADRELDDPSRRPGADRLDLPREGGDARLEALPRDAQRVEDHEERSVRRHHLQDGCAEAPDHGATERVDPGVHVGIDDVTELDEEPALAVRQEPDHRRVPALPPSPTPASPTLTVAVREAWS